MDHDQLGPYKVTRKLGAGAMGAVYEGVHQETGQRAAVKLLAPGLGEQQGFRARFEAEIEATRRLKHPGIVECYGFGEQDGMLFYAMECVDGVSLDDPLSEGEKFEWRKAVDIGIQICHALKHAHDRGIIHRDLKPANLMLDSENHVKLADFGIARLYGVTGMTVEGGPIGTANYMSPEQTHGEKVTERSDLYCLGCVLYALIAGRPPFVSSSVHKMLEMHRTQEPEPVSAHVRDVPEELDLIISRLLEKKPEERIPTAATLAKSLSAVLDAVKLREQTMGGSTTPVPPPPRKTGASAPQTPASRSQLGAQDQTLASTGADETYELADETLASEVPSDVAKGSTFKLAEDALEGDEDDSQSDSVFITAEEAEQHDRERREQEDRDGPRIISGGAVLLCVIVAVFALLTWWWMRPPSATRLTTIIDRYVEDGSPEAIEKAEEYIERLEQLYPDEPLLETYRPVRDEARFLALERKLERKARRRLGRRVSLPIERTYLEAISYAQINPELGKRKLEAMLALYHDAPKDEATRDYLALAVRQIERIDEQINQYAIDHVKMMKERLKHAAALAEAYPDKAASICRAIVELYDDKDWAREQVDHAKRIMGSLDTGAP